MKDKTIKRTIRIATCAIALMLIVVFTQEIAAQQQEDVIDLSTNEVLLVLDMDSLPSFVGKKFDVIFTAVTKAPTITVTMYFDGFINQPVWQETSDFFINQRATVDCVTAEILVGIAHEFYILAEDSDGESKTITKTMTVDVDDPVFTFLSLEHININNQVTEIDNVEPVAMKEGESLRLNWTVQDENFLWVRYFIDEKTNEESYGASASLLIDWKNFEIKTEGITEQTYTLKIKTNDKAKNVAEYSWQIKYSQPLDPTIPQEDYDADMAEKEQQTQDAKNGAIWGSIPFGLLGAIGAVFAAKGSRDQLKGYAGVRDRVGLVDIQDKKKYYQKTTWQRLVKSRFGLIMFISGLIICVLLAAVLCLAVFLQPSSNSYFVTYFFKTSLASALTFFLVVFAVSFQAIKGKFDDIFSNVTKEDKNTSAGWLISFFTDGDKRYLITDNFVDACNEDYFNVDFTDKGRMNYDLNVAGGTNRTIYIPAKDIMITKEGLKIEQFEMVGHKHIQEVLDGEDEEKRRSVDRLSQINETIAIELKETKDDLDKTQQNIRTLARREADDLLIAHELAAAALNKQIVSQDVKKTQGEQEKDDQGKNVSNTE